MKIKPVHSRADSDSLPEIKEENIVVIGTKSQELSYPSDFCTNVYRIEYSTRSGLSRKIEIISFSALVAFMVVIEGILAVKYGLEHVLQLRKLIMLFVVMGVVGGMMYGLSRLQRLFEECHLTIFKEGIEFSPIWNIELHKRLFRSWEDIHSVQLEDNIYHNQWDGLLAARNNNPEQITWNKNGMLDSSLMLQFDYKSGGNASIVLSKLTKTQCRCLFLAVENYVDQSKLSTEAIKLKHAIISDTTDESYTDIWMEDLETRYAITNFVPLTAGHKLQNNRFSILSALSTRGQTAVYLARDDRGRHVIVKELNANFATSDKAMVKAKELFDREAALLARTSHPNIANVIDNFVENKRVYLVLEYIPGITLRQYVKQKGTVKADTVISWTIQILDTLAFLHNQSPPIIHRDISPDNIVLRKDGTLAIIDFGAANEFMRGVTGTMVGKQSYISPEQFRGKAEPASDIYSLGATAYFLATAKDPAPLSVSTLTGTEAEAQTELDQFIQSCTSFDTSSRFHNVQETLDWLNNHSTNPTAFKSEANN